MKNNVRILYLLKSFELGGIERSTINFSEFLSEKVDFVGIAGLKGFYSKNSLINNKVNIYTSFNNFGQPIYFLKNLFKLSKILKTKKINIVHYHFRIHLPYIFFLKILFPKIKIFYTHHYLYHDFLNYFLCSDFYFAISETNKRELLNKSIFHRRVDILFNGFVVPENSINGKNIKTLGFVGRFHAIKGLDFLVSTFVKYDLAEKGYNLLIKGDGTVDEEIFGLIRSCKKIKLIKPTFRLEDIYKDIEIMIVPCRDINNSGEGLPNLVMLEAMSLGIPVIASRVRGININLVDGYNLLFFEPEDEYDLLKKVNLLSTNLDLYKYISSNGHDFVKRYYSIDVVGNILLSKYEESIN